MAKKRPYPSFMIFRDKEGSWHWNFAGPGGRILATSTQAYSRGAGCMRAIQLLKGSEKIPVVGRQQDVEFAREAAAAGAAGAGEAAPAVAEGGSAQAKSAGKQPPAAAKEAEGKGGKKAK